MRARCPHCTTVFNTDRGGVQFCPSCGKQINVPTPAPAGAADAPPGPGPSVPSPPPPSPSGGGFGASPSGPGGSLPPPPPPPPGGYPGYVQQPLPAPGEEPPTPWEDRGRLGIVKAYFATVKDVCFAPDRFWRNVSPTRSWGDALTFAWISQGLGILLAAPLLMMQMRMSAASTAGQPEELRRYTEMMSSPGFAVAYIAGTLLMYPLLFVIGAAITHLLCMLLGAGQNGFGATARAMGYAQAPILIAAVPCVGIAGGLYSLVLLVWGISATQRTEWWRPLVALLLPGVLLCCCAGVAAMVAAGSAAGMSQ